MKTQELTERIISYQLKANEARIFGFTEEEAKKIVQERFIKNLGL